MHSSAASTPSSRGLPVGPGRCRTPSHAAARPRRAKLADRWRCGAASTFTTNAPCPRIARRVRLPRSKQTSTSGGFSDRELTALAVVPTGSPSSSIDVTTVTPVAKWPIACRNSDALIWAGDSSTAAIGRYPIISICKIAFPPCCASCRVPSSSNATCSAIISGYIARFNSQLGRDDPGPLAPAARRRATPGPTFAPTPDQEADLSPVPQRGGPHPAQRGGSRSAWTRSQSAWTKSYNNSRFN